MRFVITAIGVLLLPISVLAADDYVLWYATKADKAGKVEWKKLDKTFSSEEDVYTEAKKVGKRDDVKEVRVLKSNRPSPMADSPIFAGRVAVESSKKFGFRMPPKFTFNKDGTVTYTARGDSFTFKYTIDGDELQIVWVFNKRVSDQVYKIGKAGFEIVKEKARGDKEWFMFEKGDFVYKFSK